MFEVAAAGGDGGALLPSPGAVTGVAGNVNTV